jgi:SAM-dependent methyltransferase
MPARSAGEVEQELLRQALATAPPGLVLDVGCGSGRLRNLVRSKDHRYLGLDRDRDALPRAKAAAGAPTAGAFVRADASRLPCPDGCAAVVATVRVYHRLRDPDGALAEVARVLGPGGHLVLFLAPRPSGFTLVRDVQDAGRSPRPPRSLTFAGTDRSEVTTGEFPGFVESYPRSLARLDRSGFDVVRAYPYGWESLPLFRRLPGRFWLRLGRALRRGPGFPYVLVVARRRATAPTPPGRAT